MPKLLDIDAGEIAKTTFGFSYSHIGVEKLTASNYTIVHMVTDKSGSVRPFKDDLEQINKTVVQACQNSPESENLLIRATAFDSEWTKVDIEELHGFTLLSAIDPNQYIGTINPRGGTPLYDATLDALDSLKDFSIKLSDEQHLCNSILFVITDGIENTSHNGVDKVKQVMKALHKDEELESFTAILIGIDTKDLDTEQFLDDYNSQAGFDQFVPIEDATPKELAKLAMFISQSISSTSQALGSGGASVVIDPNTLSI